MLEVRDITKIYNPGTLTEQRLFEHFSLTVEEGQFVAIVGSNGSGKTSLLNIICGSIPIEGGDVLVGSRSISKLKDYQRYATMGRVYQDPAAGTCPNLTMLENLSLADNKGGSYGLGRGVNKKRIDFYRQQLASLGLGLEDKLDVRMGALSGGQRQAVALLHTAFRSNSFMGTMTTGAHNVLLEYWLNVGLFGLASYFIALLASFRQMRKLERQNYIFCAAYMLWFMVMGWTERSMSTYEYQMVFLFLARGVGSNKPRPVRRRRARLEKEAT